MAIADNVRTIRLHKGLKQLEVAEYLHLDRSAYSKMEKGQRNLAVEELQRLAQLFDMTIDEVVNYDGHAPRPVTLADKPERERLRLIEQLDDDDKATLLALAEKLLMHKRFRDFFAEHAPAQAA